MRALLFFLLVASVTRAATPWQESLRQVADHMTKQQLSQSVVIASIDKGQLDFAYAGRLDSGKLPDADTFFELGSVTKVLTTTALARMVVEKKVSLDDTLDKFFPATKGRE